MDQNTEYEIFTQEIYQELTNAHGITTSVKHNIKLIGQSGQAHQIDVYWEYEIKGERHKVAIECKNYNRKLSVDKVNAFRGLLADLTGVKGIMITQKGYQVGAKIIAASCGINLKELRLPDIKDNCNIAEIELKVQTSLIRRLYLLDTDWAKGNNIDWLPERNFSASLSQESDEWGDGYLPLSVVGDAIYDEKGHVVAHIEELSNRDLQKSESVFDFENAYVRTRNWGKVKLKSIKIIKRKKLEQRLITIDARNITRAILKDALSGEIMFFSKRDIDK